MNAAHRTRMVVLIACIGFLYGCAGSQTKDADGALADTLGRDNLDLLFATEFPVASKQEAISKSNLAYRDGELDKALFYSVKALKFDTEDVDLLVRIAHLHMLQGNGRMAARAFNLALAQDPLHGESLQGLGLLYFEAGQPEKAREKLEPAVRHEPSLWRAWNVLGVLADERREYRRAADHYQKALELRPDSVSVLINRGWSHYLAGDLETAAKYLYDVGSASGHPKAWHNLGVVYAELGWYEEALDIFRKVQDEAAANNSVGEIALANGELAVARDFFDKAVRESPVYFAAAEQNLARLREERRN